MKVILHGEINLDTCLVLDAHLRQSLAIIRSLGKQEIMVFAGSENKSAMGFLSKYCQKKYLLPNTQNQVTQFIRKLINILKEENIECIFTSDTFTTYLIAKYQDEISKYTKIMIPPLDIFLNVFDKEKLLYLARENGVPIPNTYSTNDLEKIKNKIRYPVVIKSTQRHAVGVMVCNSFQEIQKNQKKMMQTYGPCIIQEYIPNGGEIGVYVLLNNKSQLRTAIVQRRIRTSYSYGGVSTVRQTIRNEELIERSIGLLKKLSWSGVAMVEYRIDKRTGTAYLMEINPRFWGSLESCIHAGIDFPFLLYCMLKDGDVKPVFDYQDGVKTRWLFGDIRQLLHNFGKQNNTNFFSLSSHDDIISKDDMLPSITGCLSIYARNKLHRQKHQEI